MVAAAPPSQRPNFAAGAGWTICRKPSAAVTEAAEEAEMPLPSDPRTFFLGGLFALGVLAALYVARFGHPSRRVCLGVESPSSTRCPSLGGVCIYPALSERSWAVLLGHWSDCRSRGGLIGTGRDLGGAAARGHTAPGGTSSGYERADPGIAEGDPTGRTGCGCSAQPGFDRFGSPRSWHNGRTFRRDALPYSMACLRTVLVLYFLLVAGNIFLRRIVEILPTFSNKRQAVDISQQIQEDISAYLVTITAMNAAVGVTTALAMYLCGLGDPLAVGHHSLPAQLHSNFGAVIRSLHLCAGRNAELRKLMVGFAAAGPLLRHSPRGG